jgi:hypothetical protein
LGLKGVLWEASTKINHWRTKLCNISIFGSILLPVQICITWLNWEHITASFQAATNAAETALYEVLVTQAALVARKFMVTSSALSRCHYSPLLEEDGASTPVG